MSALAERYGYRGACLAILGVIWILFGFSALLAPKEPRSFVLHEMLPVWIRALLWVTSGAVAIWFGLRGADKDDTWGMVALVILPVERMVSFLVSWIVYVVLGLAHRAWPEVPVDGYDRGWYAASVWLLIVVLLRVIAGWPNPRRVLPLPPSGASDV